MESLKTPKVNAVKPRGNKLLKIIVAENDVHALKTIRPVDLKYLGYVFDNTHKAAISGNAFELWMILDEDTKREASFSFLLSKKHGVGMVLNHSFTHYLDTCSE